MQSGTHRPDRLSPVASVVASTATAATATATAAAIRPAAILTAAILTAAGALPAKTAGAAIVELHCDQVTPDERLGIQQTYQGGDCLPGPPGSAGNLVGFAFPFDNGAGDGVIVGVRIYFVDPRVSSLNVYLWADQGGPQDACGSELEKLLSAPIQGGDVYSDFAIDPPVPMALGQRVWLGAIYESTGFPPSWAVGRIAGSSEGGRGFANVTGNHRDWFDLHDFGLGQCYAVRLVLDTNHAPVAEAGPPACGAIGADIPFDASASFDPDGDVLAYRWDFGDGGTATGTMVTHAYGASGSYAVVLTASDQSAMDSDTTSAHIEVPFNLRVPEEVTLPQALALASSCPVDTVVVAPGIYEGPFVLSSSQALVVAPAGPAATELVTSAGSEAVLTMDSGQPTIRGFRVRGTGPGILARAPATIDDCWVTDCGGTGIIVDAAVGTVVTRCLVAGNSMPDSSGGGIELAGKHTVSQSTLHGNGGFAILARPYQEQLLTARLEGSILSGSLLGPGLVCRDGAFPIVLCTDIWSNAGGNANCGRDGGENFSADPLFCDPQSGDFQLAADSPCLDRPVCGTVGAFGQGCGPVAGLADAALSSAAATVRLSPPAPNPFQHGTQLAFVLGEAARVRLEVYDVPGRLVRLLDAGDLPAGDHQLVWDGRSDAGEPLSSGIYLLRLHAGGERLVERALLLR